MISYIIHLLLSLHYSLINLKMKKLKRGLISRKKKRNKIFEVLEKDMMNSNSVENDSEN